MAVEQFCLQGLGTLSGHKSHSGPIWLPCITQVGTLYCFPHILECHYVKLIQIMRIGRATDSVASSDKALSYGGGKWRYSTYVTNRLNSVLCSNILNWVFFTLDKSIDEELQNGISYTAVDEQWESNSALKVDQLAAPLLRKWPLNVLVHLLDNYSLSTPIQHCSHPHMWGHVLNRVSEVV